MKIELTELQIAQLSNVMTLAKSALDSLAMSIQGQLVAQSVPAEEPNKGDSPQAAL